MKKSDFEAVGLQVTLALKAQTLELTGIRLCLEAMCVIMTKNDRLGRSN